MKRLELRDVVVDYERKGQQKVRAVAGASLSVEEGQIVGLVGETGCGKSSLARAAVGLVPLVSGEVLFEGKTVSPLSRKARPQREARLQMIFQDPFSSLNPRRRIGDQIADGIVRSARNTTDGSTHKVALLLERVGLDSRVAQRYPQEFSGGQRQRIAIARALGADPSVIIADEPLSALDSSAQAQIATMLRSLCRELNVSLMLISHDLAVVRHIADIVVVMYLGVIVEIAKAHRLWSEPVHPYTQALIDSIPDVDSPGVLPKSLGGEVPDPAKPPAGCRFHPRCPYVFDRCPKETPQLLHVPSGSQAACWLHAENADLDSNH